MILVIEVSIYLDVLVVVNTYMTWILLSLTAVLSHTYSKPSLRAWASLLGGLSSLLILIPQSVKVISFTVVLLKILSCVAVTTLAFWRVSLKKHLILAGGFLLANMLLSAFLEVFQRLLRIPQIVLSSGFIYLDISPLTLIASTAVIYLIILKMSKTCQKNLGETHAYRVSFKIGCKVYSLDGVADTGNTAVDLFSGLPVIICTGVDINPEGFIRAVPYKTVSGGGILYAANPGKVTLTDERGKTSEVSALVAGTGQAGEKRAIFNPQILI